MLINFLTWLIVPNAKTRRRPSAGGSDVSLLLAWCLLLLVTVI